MHGVVCSCFKAITTSGKKKLVARRNMRFEYVHMTSWMPLVWGKADRADHGEE